jgi:hypothetical protein
MEIKFTNINKTNNYISFQMIVVDPIIKKAEGGDSILLYTA